PLPNRTGQVALQTRPVGKPRRGSSKRTVSLVNTRGQAIDGPIYLVLDGLKKKVKLRNASGRTASGSPFLKVDPGTLAAGASIRFTLSFTGGTPHYTLRVLAGLGAV